MFHHLELSDHAFLMFIDPCQPHPAIFPASPILLFCSQNYFHNLVHNSVDDFRRGSLVQQTLRSSTDICYAKFIESEN